jgi:M3 family oligoendopeptidase
MKFQDYPYSRPNMKDLKLAFSMTLDKIKNNEPIDEQEIAFEQINLMRQEFDTMFNINYIRHSIDTKNEFYESENNFFDENLPEYQALITEFYAAVLASPLKAHLEKKWGKQLFVIAESSQKTFIPAILEDLQEENKLSSEYTKLKAAAQIEVNGQSYNLSGLIPLETGNNRDIRKEASTAKWAFFNEKQAEIEDIFDDLVQTRHEIASKLGYRDFIQLGYQRMLRSDYNSDMVANFRRQVHKHIVPLATKLYERQAKRIGLKKLKYYDEEFKFSSGNPTPKGSPEWIVNHAATMYKELSPETHEFFQFMQNNDLMDLVNRPTKATGGYCTFIPKQKAPYIFSNFNGTSGDIDVLTHEAGHAFQVYSSRNIGIPEYNWPTYESCEIHSMSMEFFTWPWMHHFFEGDVDKYKFMHLSSALQFLPYGVAVDEFQHVIYQNPFFSPEERNAVWREIEDKYFPHRDYDGNAFLKQGTYWQKQNHIFNSPFYYIDYALAQICAFQFWKKDQEDHESAWADYIRLCQAGGSHSFLDLVKLANLRSPFDDDCVASVVGDITQWLDSIDDSKF